MRNEAVRKIFQAGKKAYPNRWIAQKGIPLQLICIALVAVILLFSTIARMIVENRSSHNGYFIDGEPEIITNID